MRVVDHPILGRLKTPVTVEIDVDGEKILALEGEPIAAALIASGKSVFRYTRKRREERGVFCAIGRCTDCMMVVDGVPNVRTCITPVQPGMRIDTQNGLGSLRRDNDAAD
jgi:predicted molibdopterin-dependent oxidoreductase YjgC